MERLENAILVVNKTRLEQLVERFSTKAQARFYIENSGGDFGDYEREHVTFQQSLDQVSRAVYRHLKMKVVDRKFLPNYIFTDKDVVVVIGQDGLVANTAKYAKGLPILAVNPDVTRYDGILLPFTPQKVEVGLQKLLEGNATMKKITMAEARTNDGQHLLAFNDLFIGPATHTSARYRISHASVFENQSSSGIIVSTGAGSTGWLSSVINMSNGIQSSFGKPASQIQLEMNWEDHKLVFVVREPFRSRYSQATLTAGIIQSGVPLKLESFMPTHGIIFSDGIESDFLQFNAGATVEIDVAKEFAMLVGG